MGDHEGVELYTEGQSARISGAPCKYFVSFKDIKEGHIYVAAGATHPAQLSISLSVSKVSGENVTVRKRKAQICMILLPQAPLSDFNWLDSGLNLEQGDDCKVRLRHRQDEVSHESAN